MPKDLLKRYGKGDNFLDIADQNKRAELIEFLLSSTPDDGFVGDDGIYPRRGKVKSIVFATGQIVASSFTDNRYNVKLLKDRFRPADTAGVVNLASGNLTTNPDNETEIFAAINLSERFPQGTGGSHLITSVGWIVRVLIATIEFAADDRRKLAFFWLPARPLLFPVFCSVDGGSAGNESTNCSFTYTVKTIDESGTLDAGVSPERRRIKFTKYLTESTIDAADGDSDGIAFFDPTGTLKLQIVFNELPVFRTILFPVDCVKDGGVAGDENSTCTFTYTVSDAVTDEVIGFTIPVERARMPNTTYTVGLESLGFGYFDDVGTYFLMMVLDELPDPLPCPESSGA